MERKRDSDAARENSCKKPWLKAGFLYI